MNTNLINQIIH